MRHCGAAALPFAEGFFGFANFGALQVPDFERNTLECRTDMRQRAQILRVAVTLNHLGGDGSNTEAQPLADLFFNSRAQVRSRTHGTGNFPHGHLRCGIAKTLDVALVFGEPVGDFQAKSNRLRVDSVRASDLRRVAEFVRAEIQNFSKHHQVALNQLRNITNLQRLRGVHHIVRSHAIVQPASGGRIADGFANGHGERDDVMLHARFKFVNARHVHFGARANCHSRFFRDLACLRESFCSGNFHFQPLGEAVRVAPDMAHLRARIAWNQMRSPKTEKQATWMPDKIPISHDTAVGLENSRRGLDSRQGLSKFGMRSLASGHLRSRHRDAKRASALKAKGLSAGCERQASCFGQGM